MANSDDVNRTSHGHSRSPSLGGKLIPQHARSWPVRALAGASMIGAGLFAAPFSSLSTPASAASSCVPAGATGLTAAMVVSTGISNASINAAGCDLGIYVPPGSSGVVINGVTVTGANDHAILAEHTTGLTIENSTITGNGLNPTPGIDTNKAVLLVGVTSAVVSNNTVSGNLADGGISVTDEGGGVDPGAPSGGPSVPVPSSNVTVEGNKVSGNYGGCGIIVESWAAGAGVSNVTVSGNQVTGSPFQFGPHGPVIGQIVVATDAPGASISNVAVSNNTVSGSFVSGVTVHANAPGDSITGTSITGNTLSDNNWGDANGAPQTTAIALEVNAIPPPVTPILSGTTVSANTMTGQFDGVWQSPQVTGTTMSGNTFSGPPSGHAFYQQPAPGSGYLLATSAGNALGFGSSSLYGSLPGMGITPTAGIVGISSTRDSGGYVMAGADGGVFTFGDANFYGSLPAEHIVPAKPIVGITTSPVVSGPPGTPGTNGLGYWLVAADGGVFNFGDAHFFGSMGAKALNAPVVGIAATPDGLGYWLVAKDGGVFSFGDAGFFGSMGAKALNAPIVGIAATPDGHGYWLVAADGGVFSFGDAGFFGSAAAQAQAGSVVGAS